MLGQIIIVNGTSGSGKSTACELFAKQAEDFWLLYGIDHFLAKTLPSQFGHHGARSWEGIHAEPLDPNDPDGPLRWRLGRNGMKAFHVLHEWAASASRQGCNIILDHLLMTDPPVLQDCIERLRGLPVLLVTLKPPFEVLQQRIATRSMNASSEAPKHSPEQLQIIRDRLHRLRPWFYDSVYANDLSDLEIDTVAHSPEQVCAMINARLAEGPGTAFERLRQRYS